MFEKRKYQEEAVVKCVDAFLVRDHKSVMLESPVGSGKTYMALETIHRFQEKLGRRIKVNWVAPRRHLLQQVMEVNRDLYRDDIRPISLFDRHPPEAEFVVLDEAHHEATQSCVLLYERMRNTWTLGLSATPLRTDRMKLSFQETVRTYPIGRLIREDYLSPFNSYIIPKYSVDEISRFYLAEKERWGKSIVFFSTIAECVDFKSRLAHEGVICEVVTSESDKDRQLELFAQGTVPVIANVAMLSEGFDQPDVRTVFARDASRLPTIQMCGRGLRKAPGKEACNIVQSVNTSYMFERVCDPKNAFRFQEGRWLALKDGTKEIEDTIQETLRRIADIRKKDRAKRKFDYQMAKSDAADRFERRRMRIVEEEKRQQSYYKEYASLYRQLYHLYQLINVECWGGQLPKAVIHLRKKAGSSREVTEVVRNFMRIGDAVYPAIVTNLQNCDWVTPRKLAKEIVHATIHLNQLIGGGQIAHDDGFAAEAKKIGLNIESNVYQEGSAVGRVFLGVSDSHYDFRSQIMRAGEHPYKGTDNGDKLYFQEKVMKKGTGRWSDI